MGKDPKGVILLIGGSHSGKTSFLKNLSKFKKSKLKRIHTFRACNMELYEIPGLPFYFLEVGNDSLEKILNAPRLRGANESERRMKGIYEFIKRISVVIYVIPFPVDEEARERICNLISRIPSYKKKYFIFLFTYSELGLTEGKIKLSSTYPEVFREILSPRSIKDVDIVGIQDYSLPFFKRYMEDINKCRTIKELEGLLDELNKDLEALYNLFNEYSSSLERGGARNLLTSVQMGIDGIRHAESLEGAYNIYSSIKENLDGYLRRNLTSQEVLNNIYIPLVSLLNNIITAKIIEAEIIENINSKLVEIISWSKVDILENRLIDTARRFVDFVRDHGGEVVGICFITNSLESKRFYHEKTELNRNSFDGILKIMEGLEKEEIMWKESRNNITRI